MIHMGIQRDNPSCDVVPSAMQFVFNPNGEIGESPGQRPGFGNELDAQALKGRYEDARGMR